MQAKRGDKKQDLIYVPCAELGLDPPEALRKLGALRKKRSKGYILNEKRPKGTYSRKCKIGFSLSPKG